MPPVIIDSPQPRLHRAAGPVPAGRSVGERPFWHSAGAAWRQLAGSFNEAGFSFEWHEWEPRAAVKWSESFHPHSVEVCLNLDGSAWVSADSSRIELVPGTAGFFVTNGRSLIGERQAQERHRFLSIEFSIDFLRARLSRDNMALHPLIRRCVEKDSIAGLSEVTPLNHRRQELLASLLKPPVLQSAQRLWYESKALEFAAEFFFCTNGPELLCSRAQRLATERVERAKRILLEHLAEPPSLEELGRQVACSQFYLSRTFTQQTGLTISQFVRRARLERAAELLQSGKHNVTEVALEVGYSSLSHFSQAFHETFGCCPGLYPIRTPTQRLR